MAEDDQGREVDREVTVRLAETFYSLQGEGELSGQPTFFVRLSGCSVAHCPLHPSNGGYCDTDWSHHRTSTISEVAAEAKASGAHWVCVTGGEPTDQMKAANAIAEMAHRNNQRTMIQTSGIREVTDCWDWIVVSPKQHFIKTAQKSGHELKLAWSGEDFGYLYAMVKQTNFLRYYLMPIWKPDGTTNINEVARIVLLCGERGLPWRLTVQQHKLWGGR